MYDRLKRLYLADRLTIDQLQHAVDLGWITADQMQEIIDSKKTNA